MDNESEDMKVFAELAKVKSEPMPIKVDEEEGGFLDTEEGEGQLTVDVYQDKDAFIVQSAVAGINPDDLDIHITSESVTIRGKREKAEKIEEKDYLYQECFWGSFSRSIILPQEIDTERATSTLKNGVLTIRLPKLNRSKVKKIKIKTD